MKKAVILKFRTITELLQFRQDHSVKTCEILPGFILKCLIGENALLSMHVYRAQAVETVTFRNRVN